MSSTRTVLQTERQAFDVEIEDNVPSIRDGKYTYFTHITVRVGGDDESPYGEQNLRLRIRSDSSFQTILRDWAEVMALLPMAIMEHNL